MAFKKIVKLGNKLKLRRVRGESETETQDTEAKIKAVPVEASQEDEEEGADMRSGIQRMQKRISASLHTCPSKKQHRKVYSVGNIDSKTISGDRYQSPGSFVTEVSEESVDDDREKYQDEGGGWDPALTQKYNDAVMREAERRKIEESAWLRTHTLSPNKAATIRHREFDDDRSQASESSLQVLYRIIARGMNFTEDDLDYRDRDIDDGPDDRGRDIDADDESHMHIPTNLRVAALKTDGTCDNDDLTPVAASHLTTAQSEISDLSLTRESPSDDGNETAFLNNCGCFPVPAQCDGI